MATPDASRHTPLSMDGNPTIDERASHCFGCGPANPQGLHLVFSTDNSDPEHPTATAQAQLDRHHEGPPGYLHGGLVATLLDEAMSKLNRPLNVLAMTRHMEVDYIRPVPLYKPLTITSRHIRREGRKLFHQAEILLNDTVLARGHGLFIAIDEKLLAAAGLTQPED
ncbi:PaaI family thioesterase [Edaphobacter flagellatus]|uniref:PaaI family thioesterase n=1 Tax=Edaphobacter flagellatus TaxID=1933044 RepID=UPI0021B4A26F|nr:PaaI family thioesterase [Edaphobacter flagellatus]